MSRQFFAVFLLLVAVVLSGCTSNLNFAYGSPYQSSYRVDDGVIVAFPDGLAKEEYKIRAGGFFWEKKVYIVPVGQVYSSESLARLEGLFLKGVTTTNHSTAKLLDPEPSAEAAAKADGKTEIDRILDEMAKQEKDKDGKSKDKNKNKKKLADFHEDLYAEAGLELLRQKDANYVLWYNDALFFVRESRLVNTYRVRLVDRRTGNILLDKRYSGRSQVFQPAQSSKTNEEKLQVLTRQAFAGSMAQLVEDIATALDARGT